MNLACNAKWKRALAKVGETALEYAAKRMAARNLAAAYVCVHAKVHDEFIRRGAVADDRPCEVGATYRSTENAERSRPRFHGAIHGDDVWPRPRYYALSRVSEARFFMNIYTGSRLSGSPGRPA